MANSDRQLINCVDVAELNLTVSHPNGTNAIVTKIGNIRLNKDIILHDVLVVPDYSVNLLSVSKLAKDNRIECKFNSTNCYIQDCQEQKLLMIGNQLGGLYIFNHNDTQKNGPILSNSHTSESLCKLWHNRLGHPSFQVFKHLGDQLSLKNGTFTTPCEVCHRAKQTRSSFMSSDHKATAFGDLVHLDVWGPFKVTSKDGYRYFLTIVDDFIRTVLVYLLKNKGEVLENVQSFVNMIKNQFNKSVKTFRSDNGSEFINKEIELFCDRNGTIHQVSCIYTPQQNGVVERKHRHLLNVARALLFQSSIPLNMWTECILTATYLINRTPSSVLGGKSPFEMLFNRKPSLHHLRQFGCLSFATVNSYKSKFDARSEKCVFIGYSAESKGYKLLSLDEGTIIVSRDVKFYENCFPFKELDSSLLSKKQDSAINFFDYNYDNDVGIHNPNDEERIVEGDGNTFDSLGGLNKTTSETGCTATPDELTHDSPEGISQSPHNENINVIDNNLRRSHRVSQLPKKLSDFVIEGRVKYGMEKVVNY